MMQSSGDNLRRKRRKELEGFYTDSARQQAFFKVFFFLSVFGCLSPGGSAVSR
jgi:hypothetical protein